MKRGWLGLLIVACIGWLLAGYLLGLRLWPRGDPAPAVTLNPTPAEAKPADRVIKIDLYGQGSGQGRKITPGRLSAGGDSERIEPGTGTYTGEPVQPITGQSDASEPEDPPRTPDEPGLMVGDQVEGTWSGEAAATVTDTRTGRLLDSGTVSLEGTFMATVPAPGELSLKLDFGAPLTVAYTRPRPLFSLRAGAELDWAGGLAVDAAIGRQFFIDGLTAWGWARRDRAGDVLLGVRLEYQVDVPPF